MSKQRILELEALVEQLEEDLYQDISISNELFEENQELTVKVRGLKLIARELVEALEVEISLRGEDITYHRRSDECSICTRMLQNNKVLAKAKEVLGDEN